MKIERDIEVPTRAGPPIVADVFRPETDEPLPVVASLSPYGKDVHWPDRFPLYDLVEHGDHMVWETPNPEWWTDRGYAVVRADARGTGKTRGPLDLLSAHDAEDFYDLIEWCGTRAWSNGRVASSGISWYAMAGWRVAALQPPHLAALIAWEGLTDIYREWARQGGIYADGFTEFWWRTQVVPQQNGSEAVSLPDEFAARELIDDWYRERSTDLSQVEVPLLSAGNWGALHLHLRGNIEGWLGAASNEKWLVVHTGTHIDPYYADWAKNLQLRFLDRHLKGIEDAMDGVAPVRLAIRHADRVEWRDETAWPLARTAWRELYLDGEHRLDWDRPPQERALPYPADFSLVVDRELELTGPVALRLWLISESQTDFDVFVRIDQFRSDGRRVEPIGPQGPATPVPAAIGWLRASHRTLDPERSLPWRPFHTHDRIVPVPLGEPTLLEVEVWPTSLTLAPGERLQLRLLAGDDDLAEPMRHSASRDRRPAAGISILTGGAHPSHLLAPVIDA